MNLQTLAKILLLVGAVLPGQSQTVPSASAQAAAASAGLYRIAGTVVNAATGDPVRRAAVAVLSVANSRTLQSVLSDEEGRFALDGLSATKYQLTASKRGYRTGFYDQHEDFNSAIVTGDGQDTEHLSFRLTPEASLRGVIAADDGEPVEAASVMLFIKPRGHNPGDRITMAASASSDDSGAYEFANLAPGEYLLAVDAEPWYAQHHSHPVDKAAGDSVASLDLSYPVTYFDSTTDEASATPIILAAGGRAEANISLHAVPSLHLLVPVTGASVGAPLPELRQFVYGNLISSASAEAKSNNPSSTVEFKGLAPGHYELQKGSSTRSIDLDGAADLQIDAGVATPMASVSGTLRAVSGSALPEEVNLTLTQLDSSGSRQQLEVSARKGQFRFPAVLPGEWTLSATSAGTEWQILSIAADGKTHSGDQLAVQDRAVSLAISVSQDTTRIEGFAQKDGKGMAGIMIVLVPQDPGSIRSLFRRDQSDSDGSFVLLDAAAGQYKVIAIEDGWELDWAQPAVLARYLSQGIDVSIDSNSGKRLRLSRPIPIQPR